jgi:YD repeat-containing protein
MTVIWLRLGDLQLHLFQRSDSEAPRYHHIGIDVDDFESFLERAEQLGVVDADTISRARVLESGEVQAYIRDPAGNLVEVNWPDVTTLSPALRGRLKRLADDYPQDGDAATARLYMEPSAVSQ